MAGWRAFLFAVVAAWPVSAAAETFLLMAEEPGCVWCALWDREISAIYPETPEGRAAPLKRFALRGGPPADVAFARRIRFTPTFVLVRDGTELGRIEGYPGEDFFWGLLGSMLGQAGIDVTGPAR